MNQATREFIAQHLHSDLYSLSLLASKNPEVDIPLAIRQITGKQKVKHKIPTFWACEELLYPVKLSLEQSSSEITAQHKTAGCKGKLLVDLTGGFGVDSYFFSFHFEQIIYVERDAELCELAKHNFKALGRHNITVVNDTAENYLPRIEGADWIYLDPARRTQSGQKAVLLSDCEPDIALLAGQLPAKGKKVMIKLSPMIDTTSLARELKQVEEIQIIAVENECKEVVTILGQTATDQPALVTANYPKTKTVETFHFSPQEEQTAAATYTSNLHTYLYEPNAAVMKGGAFKLVSQRFELDKLHANSHLYTSDKLIEDFPGRIFRVENVYGFSKESLKELRSKINKANLTVRNFPLSVNELRKKLKLAEGGNDYLFATTLSDESKVLVQGVKVER